MLTLKNVVPTTSVHLLFLSPLSVLSYVTLNLLTVVRVLLTPVRRLFSVAQPAGLIRATVVLVLLMCVCRALTPCLSESILWWSPRCLVPERLPGRLSDPGPLVVVVVVLALNALAPVSGVFMGLLLVAVPYRCRHRLMLLGTRARRLLSSVYRRLAMCLTKKWLRAIRTNAFG